MAIRLTVFSDFVCPFCYIGEGLVEKLRQEPDLGVEVTWMPFQLNPATPPEGLTLAEYFGGRMPPDRLAMMHAELKARAGAMGLPMDPPPFICNTRRAHELAEFARDRGRLDALVLPLFQAYFVQGRNLYEERVLGEAAEAAGLDPAEALEAVRAGRYADRVDERLALAGRYGIHSVPTFIVNERYKIVGAQPYEVLRDALRSIAQEG